jgi:hypothetical protein
MSLADEFVKRLATVKCSETQHPILPRPPTRETGLGVQGFIDTAVLPPLTPNEAIEVARYASETKAQCKFCIARETIKAVEDEENRRAEYLKDYICPKCQSRYPTTHLGHMG